MFAGCADHSRYRGVRLGLRSCPVCGLVRSDPGRYEAQITSFRPEQGKLMRAVAADRGRHRRCWAGGGFLPRSACAVLVLLAGWVGVSQAQTAPGADKAPASPPTTVAKSAAAPPQPAKVEETKPVKKE